MAVTTFKNIRDNKSGTLLTAITATQTTLTLNTGQGASFPAAPFYISCDYEVMICTAKVGDVFTVTRGADNTIGAIHAAGSLVEMRSVAALWNDLAAAVNALEGGTNVLTNPHWIGPIVDSGGLTITLGDLTVSAGNIVMGAATSRIIPGATSFSIRNNANNADNLLVSDAGLSTIRNGLLVSAGNVGIGGAPLAAADLALYSAASKIVPGATSLSLRNNANNADNLSMTDAGVATIRGQLTVGNGLVVAAGSILVPQPGSSVLFGIDAGSGGSVSVPNAGAYGVFGAGNVFGGLLIVHDVSNGEAALIMVASATTAIVFQSGTTFSITPGAAAKTSVYLTSGAVTIQNNVGATHFYQFLSLRSRGTA